VKGRAEGTSPRYLLAVWEAGGHLGAVGTYLPGRRVTGVVLREEDVEVHVIGRYGT
jgi:hypothetical protein